MQRFERECVVVLAAGQGKRMGGPKALTLAKGKPLWLHQHERLQMMGLRATWVVSPEVRRAIEESNEAPKDLVEADSTLPMLASVLAGVRSLPINELDGIFILPIDVPAPPENVWSALATSTKPCIPACQGVKGHPVRLTSEWVKRCLLTLDSAGDQRLDRLLDDVSESIEIDDPSILINLNTPADLDEWASAGC